MGLNVEKVKKIMGRLTKKIESMSTKGEIIETVKCTEEELLLGLINKVKKRPIRAKH